MTEREPDDVQTEEAYVAEARESSEDTDVLLDVPVLNVEELDLEVEELQAHISARAELAGFLNINVGVDAYINGLKLNIKGVEAQVQLKVKLERILSTIERALDAIDNNPDLLNTDSNRGGRPERREGPRELEAASHREEPEQGADGVAATPAAKKKAEELGIDLAGLDGTGADGRVLIRDVLQAAKG